MLRIKISIINSKIQWMIYYSNTNKTHNNTNNNNKKLKKCKQNLTDSIIKKREKDKDINQVLKGRVNLYKINQQGNQHQAHIINLNKLIIKALACIKYNKIKQERKAEQNNVLLLTFNPYLKYKMKLNLSLKNMEKTQIPIAKSKKRMNIMILI